MTDGVSMTCDVSGALAFLDAFGAQLRDQTTRRAAQAGAQVMVDEVRQRVASIGRDSGNLADSIYQAYSKDNSGPGHATYHVSWNAVKAPHGHLIEYGHWRYYATYTGPDGKPRTAVRPSMRGMPKPARRASRAQKDAYYVPLAGGPVWVAARPFIRPAYEAKKGAAQDAITRKIAEEVAAFTGMES